MGGIIGRKVGMTRVFDDTGNQVPVTVVEAGPCPVTQVKTPETDGYAAIQLGFGSRKAKHATKAQIGHAEKAGLDAAPRILREVPSSDDAELSVGEVLTVEQFEPGDRVRVTGASKGRGFQGVVRRHGFAGRPGGHGHPLSRTPGSVGPGTDPSRVIKGKKLPGRMGGSRVTIRNLQVVKVDGERNLLFLKGGVPGARDSYVLITKSK
jgi:large subunit ribosomal protein L3